MNEWMNEWIWRSEKVRQKSHWQVRAESTEDTLRVLLVESDRIKEMISQAESKARNWLDAKSQVQCDFSSLQLELKFYKHLRNNGPV